jgi:protein-export membrane protein SecD
LEVEIQTAAGNTDDAVARTIKIFKSRLDAVGISEASVERSSGAANRILIQLPAVPNYDRLKQLVLSQAKLELREVVSPLSPAPVMTYSSEAEARSAAPESDVLPYHDRFDDGSGAKPPSRFVALVKTPVVTGDTIRSAQAAVTEGKNYQIQFTLTAAGAERFAEWTGSHINTYMAVALNDEVRSIAYIKSQISDSAQIDGKFSQMEAEDIALTLRSGGLPGRVKLVNEGVYKITAH